MAYRTKAEPGADKNGKPLLGLKMTTGADVVFNKGVVPKTETLKKISEIRSGSAAKNTGTYTINGIKCYHTSVGSTKQAVAWHDDNKYVYVEAFIEHTGRGNDYREL